MEKIKKLLKLSLMLGTAILLFSECSWLSPEPEKVVGSFIRALTKKDFTKAYGYISEEDKKYLDLDTFKKKYLILSEVFLMSKYKIKSSDHRDQQAQVVLDFKGPDWQAAYLLVLENAFIPANPDDFKAVSTEQIVQKTMEKINKPDFPRVQRDLPFELVREKKKWKIFFNVKLENSITERFQEAAELLKAGKFEAAEETIERILRIDHFNQSARGFLEKIRSYKYQQPPRK